MKDGKEVEKAGAPVTVERIVSFTVTKKAMRPASRREQCFYCQQPIGTKHKPGCVLIKKKARVRMVVEYEVEVPASWDKDMIEFHRNDGSWCADNAIGELEEVGGEDGCICHCTTFEYLGGDSAPELEEGN